MSTTAETQIYSRVSYRLWPRLVRALLPCDRGVYEPRLWLLELDCEWNEPPLERLDEDNADVEEDCWFGGLVGSKPSPGTPEAPGKSNTEAPSWTCLWFRNNIDKKNKMKEQ